ncbi:MAG: hypothetical protein RLY31_2814 [Bacteroidota bacterium]|jgi:peptidyl-prolyl cis-trans isomerase SurA
MKLSLALPTPLQAFIPLFPVTATLLLATLLAFVPLTAQSQDPVLFTVDNIPVPVSEFRYIYAKTNGDKGDYSRASLQEYLDLYVNFKLKVRKAREMQLDTIKALQQELAGYRRQLADSYLLDREVTEKLVKTVYERSRQDVDISHLFLPFPSPAPTDTLETWNKALEAMASLSEGTSFEDVVQRYATDPQVARNKGRVGFVTAPFPNGFHALEDAAYESPLGQPLGPIRSGSGYHLLKVHTRRTARGEMEVAHIMVRNEKYPDLIKARNRIDSIHQLLRSGADFNLVAKELSDDRNTASKGGYIGFFGINRFEKSFEDAAFALSFDGDFSTPVQTAIGWHIIKRISLRRDEPYHQVKVRLQNAVKQDARFEEARLAMIERIKHEAGFSQTDATLDRFVSSLSNDTSGSFLTYRWKASVTADTSALCSFGQDHRFTLGDFESYCEKASRKRQQKAREGVRQVVADLYRDFVAEKAVQYEEKQLESKYPDFKALMREYEEGVLLFEITKQAVWDKAAADSVGLESFHRKHEDRYQWSQRAVVTQFSVSENHAAQLDAIRKAAKTLSSDKLLEMFNKDSTQTVVSSQTKTIERGKNDILDQITWEPGAVSPSQTDKKQRVFIFFRVEEVIPPGLKSLQEARGYVVADYQDFLEKQWLDGLRKSYKVKIYDKVFQSLVSK